MFLDDFEGIADDQVLREELPTGVITLLTKCYAPSCTDEEPCYAYACPRRTSVSHVVARPWVVLTSRKGFIPSYEPEVCDNSGEPERAEEGLGGWSVGERVEVHPPKGDQSAIVCHPLFSVAIPAQFLSSIIFKVIKKEEQYIQDLDTVESVCCSLAHCILSLISLSSCISTGFAKPTPQ